MERKERIIKEENIKNSLIELDSTDIRDISILISKRLEGYKERILTEKYSRAFQKLKDKHKRYKEKNRMIKDYGIKLGKVNQKEWKEILKYKGNQKRDFRIKSFKRKGNLRVIYLYV